MVWERDFEPISKMILARLADNGNDHGENIFRSMSVLAREVGRHKRTVQKAIGNLVKIGVLVDVGEVTYGRGRLRGLRIDLDVLQTVFPLCKEQLEPVDPAAIAGLIRDAEKAAKEADEGKKGGEGPPFSEGERVAPETTLSEEEGRSQGPPLSAEKGGSGDEKGGPGNTKGWPQGPPEPLGTVKESSRARGGDPGGPPRAPDMEPPNGAGSEAVAADGQPLRVNRHWKPARLRFVKRFSEPEALSWWDPLIPLRHDPDGTLVLGAPSDWFISQIQSRYSRAMAWAHEQEGGQTMRFVVDKVAIDAERVRRRKAASGGAAAGRR